MIVIATALNLKKVIRFISLGKSYTADILSKGDATKHPVFMTQNGGRKAY